MLLHEVALALVAPLFGGAILFRVILVRMAPNAAADRLSSWLAALFLIVFFVLMTVRSLRFGVDTAAYVEVFEAYCDQRLRGADVSYVVSAALLNIGMFGECSAGLLPTVWAGLVIGVLLLMPGRFDFRLRYTCLLLFSMVGFELTTNALRQSLSVSAMMLSLAIWSRSRWFAVPVGGVSLILHPSAILVYGAILLANTRWTRFAALLLVSVAVVFYLTGEDRSFVLLDQFLYEVRKYLAHEDDEIYIRALAFATVVAALFSPLVSTARGVTASKILSDAYYSMALKLALTCVPFLTLPYFGYRYIYGVYPVILYLVLKVACMADLRRGRMFLVLAISNAIILLVWAGQSSYMKSVPFLE